MKRLFTLVLATYVLIFPRLGFSEEEFKIKLNGTSNFITVSKGVRKATLWGISKGKMSSYLEVSGNVPKGTKLKVYGAVVKRTVSEARTKKKRYYPLSLRKPKKLAALHSQCLDISVEGGSDDDLLSVDDYPSIDSPVCNAIGQDVLSDVASQMSQTFGGGWQSGNACSYILTIAGDVWLDPEEWCDKLTEEEIALLEPFGLDCDAEETTIEALTSPSVTVSLKGLFHKDACGKSRKYLVLVTLDFTASQAPDDKPIEFILRVNEHKRKKGREAALKPKSEGRYSPRPILMMNWLGSTCGNRIDVVKWKRGHPKKITYLNVYALLSYQNMVLNLATVDSALSGGRGTAELYNGDESYGVCFKLAKTRQNKNGYPFH